MADNVGMHRVVGSVSVLRVEPGCRWWPMFVIVLASGAESIPFPCPLYSAPCRLHRNALDSVLRVTSGAESTPFFALCTALHTFCTAMQLIRGCQSWPTSIPWC
eukprot:1053742-Rhodomonas_salina.1